MSTIFSLVTAPIKQNVAIIRISGDEAFTIAQKIVAQELNKEIINSDIVIDGEIIDNALVLTFKNPNSFTGEDVVEIQPHGSTVVVQKILKALQTQGAVQAKPGEFSQRALRNGKINLFQAEAINTIVNSETDFEHQLAVNSLKGESYKIAKEWQTEVLKLIARTSASIDYPEAEDIKDVTLGEIEKTISEILSKVEAMKEKSTKVVVLFDGVSIAIVGKPNVGKSSLLNSLLKEDKAIVSNIEGTTRDVVDETVVLNGLKVKLLDTAGIRNSEDTIESIGIERSKEAINKADLVLWVVDASQERDSQDEEIEKLLEGKKYLVVNNKSDLAETKDGINISAKNNEIDSLIEAIAKETPEIEISEDAKAFTSKRQLLLLDGLISECENILKQSKLVTPDMILVDLEELNNKLQELLGEKAKENYLDEIFEDFCLGK